MDIHKNLETNEGTKITVQPNILHLSNVLRPMKGLIFFSTILRPLHKKVF